MKKIFVILVLYFCAMLTSCEKNKMSENITDMNSIQSSTEVNGKESATEGNDSNHVDKDNIIRGTETITKKLNSIQESMDIITVDFYEDNMYVIVTDKEKVWLNRYDIVSWEEKSTEILLKPMEIYELIPFSEGVVFKSNFSFGESNNYIYDKDLNMIAECRGLFVEYSFDGQYVYYYVSDNNSLCCMSVKDGSVKIIREFGDYEEYEDNSIMGIGELCMNYDKNKIFYTGIYWKNKDSEYCWGYFDLNEESKDCRYEGNKELEISENAIIVMDSRGGEYLPGDKIILETKYNLFYKNKKEEIREFNDVEEVDSGVISSEGNIMLSAFATDNANLDNVTIYDVESGNIITELLNDEKTWLKAGVICEKYRFVMFLETIHETIHESADSFSPTGKKKYCV